MAITKLSEKLQTQKKCVVKKKACPGAARFKNEPRKKSLINQIVEATTEKNKKALAKLIAIYTNRYKLDETDLPAPLQKRHDPKIRNYTAFVKWSVKDKGV